LLDFGAGHASAQADVQALLGQGLLGFLGDLIVGSSEELVHGFQHGDFGTQASPYRAQLETDHTGADHTQLLRHALEFQGTGGVDDDVLIDRGRRDLNRLGTGSDDHVSGFDYLGLAIETGHFDLLASQQLAVTFQQGHAVGLEQRTDAAGQVLTDGCRATDHRRYVDGHALGFDTVNSEAFFGFVVLPGAVQQRLGRNATDVQAGTAERDLAVLALVFLDASGFQTELRCFDGGYVATRAGTDDYHVEFLGHNVFLLE